jgi:hypothetical protein
MSINQNTGTVITESEAINFTHTYQQRYPNEKKAYFVGSEKIDMILNQEGCIGIRIYDGLNSENNDENRVLVGVDDNGEDMVEGVIVEHLMPCPSHCPNSSSLIK